MSTQAILAEFATQFGAFAAAQKLYSVGLPRERLQLFMHVREMGMPSSSDTPTTVVDETLRGTGPSSSDALQKEPFQSQLTGRTQLTVELPCDLAEPELVQLLQVCGAERIRHATAPDIAPNPAMWPEPDRVTADDAAQATAAARKGAGLETLGEDGSATDRRDR